jgi:DnaD/phage-associated family protein
LTRMRWVKLHTQETLFGTTRRELEPAERSLWFDFLCLAGDSPEPGHIFVAPGIPYTDDQLCHLLNIPPALLERARTKMVKAGKIALDGGCIRITNWTRYQGDYVRMQRHRERVTNVTPTPAVTKETAALDKTRQDKSDDPDKVRRGNSDDLPAAATTRAERGPSQDPEKPAKNYAAVKALHEDTFGPVGIATAQVLNKLALEFPLNWIGEAYKEAATHDAKTIAYVRAILRRWRQDGYKAPPPEKRPRGRPRKQRRKLPSGEQLQQSWGDKPT